MSPVRRGIVRSTVLSLAVVLTGLGPSAAGAQNGQAMLVTYVARVCPSYEAITANIDRNNIQESLLDLGADSAYQGGEQVDVATEEANQPLCRPLPGWRFTLGRTYETRAVIGSWGRLARVNDVFPTTIDTQESTALLDQNGSPTGRTLAGAVTVPLTEEQMRLSASTSRLWVQGGLPDDPVLEAARPTERFGFGALRCAIDNLNGDNVEWIAFPQGSRHVFCFAYYVQPSPPAGTIVVRKEVDAAAGTTAPTFDFVGNISYEPDESFELEAQPGKPEEIVFPRAAQITNVDLPWRFREIVPAGWQRSALTCTSANGLSRTTVDQATGEAAVRLAADDTVTCTYRNRLQPPLSGLVVSKRTIGGIGSFAFSVSGEESARQTIATEEEDLPVAGDPLTLAAGDYELDEELPPASPRGRWERTKVLCDGEEITGSGPIPLTIRADRGSACEFTNRFVPRGAIRVRKRTIGATGRVGFVIEGSGEPQRHYEQDVTTTSDERAFLARGDDTENVPLGAYEIVETTPTTANGGGFWTLDSVVCNGVPVGFAQGRAEVRLTAAQPTADCTYVNRFTTSGTPVEPPPTSPTSTDASAGPVADLAITKRVRPTTVRPGQRARYTVVVENRGPNPATSVVVTELRAPDALRLRIGTSQGRCFLRPRPRCVVGRLEPGQRVVLTSVSRALHPGRTRNVVAVGSATVDPNLRNNQARSTLTVRRSGTSPRYTG